MSTTTTTKVLIVDDCLVLRDRLSEMLSSVNGLEVVALAENADEAIRSVQSLRPELVILDIQMPGRSGIDVLQHIKRDYPQTKVVILTNHAEPQYRNRCLELKADYFLSKLTDSNLLVEIGGQLAAKRVTPEGGDG